MNRRQRKEYAIRQAHEMANSGRFRHRIEIEDALRTKEGFSDISDLLGDRSLQKDLNRICAKAHREGGKDDI